MYNTDKAVAKRQEVAELQQAMAQEYGTTSEPLGNLEVVKGQSRLRRKRGNK